MYIDRLRTTKQSHFRSVSTRQKPLESACHSYYLTVLPGSFWSSRQPRNGGRCAYVQQRLLMNSRRAGLVRNHCACSIGWSTTNVVFGCNRSSASVHYTAASSALCVHVDETSSKSRFYPGLDHNVRRAQRQSLPVTPRRFNDLSQKLVPL